MLISVVTICYNNAQDINATPQSVLGQSFPGYEYIVVDGGSTDGTVDIVQSHESSIDHFISERDDGPYYAMNKGIECASGRYITFLNAGDTFSNEHVLGSVARAILDQACDCICGHNWLVIRDGRKFLNRAGPSLSRLWIRMQFSHQSLFVRTELAKDGGFDTSYTVSADYAMILRLYVSGARFICLDEPVSTFQTGGMSDGNRLLAVWERFRINQRVCPTWKIYPVYACLLASAAFKQLVKRVLGRARYEKIKFP